MPVVELDLGRLQKMAGGTAAKIAGVLPYLGLDIEGRRGSTIRVEYSPNRPDYSTEYGIAVGLQGLLGTGHGMPKLRARKNDTYEIRAEKSVSAVRPYITGMVARGGRIDGRALGQLVAMQEDLHLGIGRGRRRASIGIHDMDEISFPIRYTTVRRGHRFVPLGGSAEMDINQILAGTHAGQEYGSMIRGPGVPLLADHNGSTVSLPPVINSARTAITTKTQNLLVEVTGTDKDRIEDVLSVIALTLQAAGFAIHEVKVSGAGNSTAKFSTRTIRIDAGLVGRTLGISMPAKKIASCLKRSRLDASVRGSTIHCVIPRYRFDMFGPMDVIEEVALGYGIANMEPGIPAPLTIGRRHPASSRLRRVRATLTGLGYMEAQGPSLTSSRVLYEDMGRDPSGMIKVSESKSAEHTILRDSLIPGLIGSLAMNIHEPYPQRLFEVGTVFGGRGRITESTRLCAASSHKAASYTEIKSILQCVVSSVLGGRCQTPAAMHPMFEAGRSAEVILDGRTIGVAGEIGAATRARLRLREPAAAFEVHLFG